MYTTQRGSPVGESNAALQEQERSQDDSSWPRFVAVLCFIEFYVSLTHSGTELYRQTLGDMRRVAEPHIVWIAGLFIFRAFTFYLNP